MNNMFRLYLISFLIIFAVQSGYCSKKVFPLIGEIEKVYKAADDNKEIRGLAFDDTSSGTPRLFVLDGSGCIFAYRLNQDPEKNIDELNFMEKHRLPDDTNNSSLAGPRGLAFTKEGKHEIFYFLNWEKSGSGLKSQLWRCNFQARDYTCMDLTKYQYRIGQREVFDIACDNGKIFICFDASGYKDVNLRVQRGILQMAWHNEQLEFVKHMPDSGEFISCGIACMKFGDAEYLWATAADRYIYSADAATGRGLFYFDRPGTANSGTKCLGLAIGRDALWVPQSEPGADLIHRVNVTKNAGASYEGPKILRHLTMTIKTEAEKNAASPGKVYHYYSRPYAYDQLHNQGLWPETEKIVDVSNAPNVSISTFTHDPAGDRFSRQYMALVEYGESSLKTYSSRYEIDLWTNPYRKYVYPHLVNKNAAALADTTYLADDPVLYNLSDTGTYNSFLVRVKKHIENKYDVSADMDNPYWAVRNVLEYIQDNYYYPGPDEGIPATVDYSRKHYDANPANLKIELSENKYDKTQIIACSGTSVVLAGAMRFIGHPARWLGTGVEGGPSAWDKNRNGLLDKDESAQCSNGHRYTQVWLGDLYGWICFDATPSRPEFKDYDPAPPLRSQWRYMNRAARGHLLDKRIVFNVGSEFFRPLYREFEYDTKLAENNNCGGDQRYNLQGRYDKPELWKLPRHRIYVRNICFIKDITCSGSGNKTQVTWKPEGKWDKDPGATVSVYLQRVDKSKTPRDIARLVTSVPYNSNRAIVDLSKYRGKCRIIIRKDGDFETGGCSEIFDL